MNRVVSVELSEAVYARVERQAKTVGDSPEHVIADSIERQFSATAQEHMAPAGARRDKRGCARLNFGSVDLGCATGVDNERIDEDLAREYGDNHEGA